MVDLLAITQGGFKVLEPFLAQVPVIYNPYECVLAMFLIIFASKLVQATLSFALVGKYDLVQANYRNGGFEGKTWGHKAVQRAYNAHMNHWEAFTGFAVAMTLALTKVSSDRHVELALLGNAFLWFRIAYNIAYVLAFNAPLSTIRSAMFFGGVVITFRLFAIAITA